MRNQKELNVSDQKLPYLEEVLIAFQKSLGRIRQETTAAGKHDSEFAVGDRVLYMVDSLQIELKVGLTMENRAGDANDRFKVDFNAPAPSQSVLRFTVDPTVLEKPEGDFILLAPNPKNSLEYRITLIRPQAKQQPVTLRLKSSGQNGYQQDFSLVTDALGRINFKLDTGKAPSLIVEGELEPRPISNPIHFKRDWYLQAFHVIDKTELSSDLKRIRNGEGK